MLVKTKITENRLFVRLKGELDHSKAQLLKQRLEKFISQPKVTNVILQMQGMDFMDSAGVGLIMSLYKKLKNSGKKLYFQSPSPQINKVLKVSGLYSIIPLIKEEVNI